MERIRFDILSPNVIRSMSVCEVVTDELYEDNRPKTGGLRDPRFGVSSRRGTCRSCGMTWSKCSGHFGHFELPHPVYHIGWTVEVLQWLRRSCRHCGHVEKAPLKKKCTACKKEIAKYVKVNSTLLKIQEPNGPLRELFADEALEHLRKIPQENVRHYRGKVDDFHPSHLIMTVLPIPPNCVRPSPTMDGDEVRGEDDITRRLLYILRVAKGYKNTKNQNSVVRQHAMKRTQNAVHMYFDQARMSTKKTTAQKSIASRLRGKQGRLRGTLMGKRCNFTARTVITGDANLDMREVGVPQHVAKTLTVVEHVNRLNYKNIQDMISNQDPRIKYVIQKDGTRLDMQTIRGQVNIEIGCSIERTMRDGDPVLFNRQPSLHRMSIMCHKARIMKQGKTFRLNLTCTTPYNADFDGDEMNLHLLQTHKSRADALELMSVAYNIITPQANRPVMGIVQDSLLSSYMLTSPGVTLDKGEMCNMCMWVEGAQLPEPALPGPLWTGLQCMSLLFPKDFNWKDTIYQGQLLKGPLGKKALGRSHGSIIHRLYNDYGPDRTCQFINELQRLNHLWFSGQGFSIGIGDMRITPETAAKVRQECADIDAKAEELRVKHGADAEPKINRMLNQTRDSMGKIAQQSMTPDNCLGLMVRSGSKGSMVNILQIMACVGQQNCSGKRMQATVSNRTLPMFKPHDDSVRSRGFVKHSYIDGLEPDEYWHHTVGGREGLIDTAVKTSTTGYIQRRLVKSLESIHVDTDKTVRDSQQRILQFVYGEDGMDGMSHEMVHCAFDDIDALNDDFYHWPNVVEAFQLWKWNAQTRLGDKWAICIPVARYLKKYKDDGSCTEQELKDIIQPLLETTSQVPLVHAYVLSVFARTRLPCSAEPLKRICDTMIKKWHKSIVAAGEMVGTIAAQSVGEPTTQMSADYDTEVIVDIHGSVKRVKIGPLVDSILNNDSRESQEQPVTHLKCLGVSETEKVSWTNITHVSRHPANGTMLHVVTKHNRELKMTASHSFLVRRENRVVSRTGSSLVIGDALPVAKNLPVEDPFPLKASVGHFIGAVLAEGFVNQNMISFCGSEHEWVTRIAENFAQSQNVAVHIQRKEPSKHTLGSKWMTTANICSRPLASYFSEQFGKTSHHKRIPGWVLQASDEFVGALLQSYFDGDGNISCAPGHYAIRCHSVSKPLIEMVALCLARFGIPCYINKSKYKTPMGKPGTLWEGSVPVAFAKSFRKHVGFSLKSKKDKLDTMCTMTFKKGFQARIPGMSGVLSALRSHLDDVNTRKEIRRIDRRGCGITVHMLHTLLEKAKQNNIPTAILKEIEQAVNADVWWDPIVSIKQYESSSLVYDFTVNKSLQSFMLANGIFVHNTL